MFITINLLPHIPCSSQHYLICIFPYCDPITILRQDFMKAGTFFSQKTNSVEDIQESVIELCKEGYSVILNTKYCTAVKSSVFHIQLSDFLLSINHVEGIIVGNIQNENVLSSVTGEQQQELNNSYLCFLKYHLRT